MIPDIETIMDLCKLISDTFHLSSFIVSSDGKTLFGYMNSIGSNPLYNYETLKKFNPNKKYSFPIIRKYYLLESYIIISIIDKDDFKGSIIIGPSTPQPVSEYKINSLINDLQASIHRDEIINYYQSIPIIENSKLINIAILIFYTIYKTLVSPEDIINENQDIIQGIEKTGTADLSVSKELQKGTVHHSPLEEKLFYDIIKEGRYKQLKDFNFVEYQDASEIILARSSYIRSLKNNLICLITLTCRAAIDGGLNYEVAFTLSDTFIQQLEDLNSTDKINILAKRSLLTFAKKVSEAREESSSKTVITCKDFIHNHIYEEFSHNDIARAAGLSPSYLSVLFKKEVGISVTEYIQKSKIDEAITLIRLTNTPLAEICSLLNFSDQSYFTKIFTKYIGYTPKKYREMSHIIKE